MTRPPAAPGGHRQRAHGGGAVRPDAVLRGHGGLPGVGIFVYFLLILSFKFFVDNFSMCSSIELLCCSFIIGRIFFSIASVTKIESFILKVLYK